MPETPRTSTPTEILAGLVDRVTFHNLENGFCVLQVKARGQRDLITVVGHAAMISAGGADTTTPHGWLMLTVLGGLAEFERDLIRARTSEGRERAKARGVHLGRKPKLTVHQKREAIRRRDELGETLADIARTFNVSRSTISRLAA